MQPNISILNRDNIGIIAKFAPLNNLSAEFIVATTHLLYNPRREDVRLAQSQVLLTEVERMAFDYNKKYVYIIFYFISIVKIEFLLAIICPLSSLVI